MLALVKCGGFFRLLPNQQRKKRLRPASVGAGGQADAGGLLFCAAGLARFFLVRSDDALPQRAQADPLQDLAQLSDMKPRLR